MPAVARIADPVSCGDIIDQGSGNVFSNGMPVTRVGPDNTVGHWIGRCYWPPTPISEGSPNVFVNNSPMARVDDPIVTHCCGRSCHDNPIANGSPDVFAN